MASLLKAYNAVLQRRPIIAQCATSGVLFGAGDVIAQQIIEKKGSNHDLLRTARLSFYGGAIFGPLVVNWYQLLNRLQFTSPRKAVVYRTFLDQAVFSPPMVALFFTAMPLMEGSGVDAARQKVSEAYAPTLLRNWAVFVPVQIINFAVIPHHLRVLSVGVVSLFWNTYLSAVNARGNIEDELKVNKTDNEWLA